MGQQVKLEHSIITDVCGACLDEKEIIRLKFHTNDREWVARRRCSACLNEAQTWRVIDMNMEVIGWAAS